MNKLTADGVRARLESLTLATPDALTIANGYARAAATLATFAPAELQPAGLSCEPADMQAVLAACVPVAGGRVSLPDSVRIELLTALIGERGADAAIDARIVNRAPPSPLQDALDCWLTGPFPDLTTITADKARALIRVHGWLDGTRPGPTRVQLLGRLTLAEILEPLERLARGFFGREDILDRLHRYLSGPVPRPVRPLMLHGRGGIGKSSIVGAFLCEVAGRTGRAQVPWAYLDYDRRALDGHSPVTLLSEVVRQVAAQYPDAQRAAGRLHRLFSARARATDRADRSPPDRAIAATAEWLTGVAGDRPVLVVLDTFEEVQFVDDSAPYRVWQVVRLLSLGFPNLRAIFVSRVPFVPTYVEIDADPPMSQFDVIGITGLSHRDALSFLRLQLADPLPDSILAKVIATVDTSPLSLRLAAEVLRNQPAGDSFAELASRPGLEDALRVSHVQGFLYRRILAHLHTRDPILEKLAHASLAVRRVTAEVVVQVIEPVCRLGIDSLPHAHALLRALAREVAFVEDTGDGLRHRPELRAALKDFLVHSLGKATLLDIHDRAISYYQQRDAVEAAYHRRAMAPPITTNSQSPWRDAPINRSISPQAHAEFDAEPAYPTEATSLEVITERADALLAAGRVADALRLLTKHRPDLIDWRLEYLTARALAASGDGARAFVRLRDLVLDPLARTIHDADPHSNGQQFIDVMILAARVADTRAQARDLVVAALEGVSLADIDALRVRVLLLGLLDEPERSALAEQLLAEYPRIHRRQLAERPTLICALAAELGERDPSLLRLALERVGLRQLTSSQLDALADGLHDWQASQLDSGPTIADAAGLDNFASDERTRWQHLVRSEGAALDRAILDLSYRFPDTWATARVLARALANGYRAWQSPEASASEHSLDRLRDILVEIYPSTRDALRVADGAGLALPDATARRSPARLWYELLDRARRASRLAAVRDQILGDERTASDRAILQRTFDAFAEEDKRLGPPPTLSG